MNNKNYYVRLVIELLLLGIIILAILAFAINGISSRRLGLSKPTEHISNYPLPTFINTKPSPYPIIQNTLTTPEPLPTINAPQATPVPVITMIYYPTLKPYPTNTLRPGPKPTPIPLTHPAKDASGSILFLSTESNSVEFALNSLNVDRNGIPNSKVSQISTYPLPESIVYPSPDGQNIIFTIDTEGGPVGSILNLKSGKVSPILHSLHILAFLNWYPDSKHVLVELDGNGLWLFDVNSDRGTALAQPTPGAIGGAAASRDGQQIIYSHLMGISSPTEVWIVDADGHDAIKLFEVGYPVVSFSWSPDGSKIAFLGDGLMVMNADGTHLRSVSHQPMNIGYAVPAIWSPDSRFLAIDTVQFQSPNSFLSPDSTQIDMSNIYLIDVATGIERSLLSDGKFGNLDPSWSPDGSKVAFVSTRSGAFEIWEVNTDGTNIHQLTQNKKIVRLLYWKN